MVIALFEKVFLHTRVYALNSSICWWWIYIGTQGYHLIPSKILVTLEYQMNTITLLPKDIPLLSFSLSRRIKTETPCRRANLGFYAMANDVWFREEAINKSTWTWEQWTSGWG